MAMRDLIPLIVDVGINSGNGQALYPNFNLISSQTRKGMDWANYLDTHGGGWHYDATCGHKQEGIGSPFGHQWACMCVPQDFATEALNLFPDTVKEMTPLEFEAFHDVKAHAHEPDEDIDTDRLNGLAARRALMVATEKTLADTTAIEELDIQVVKALDPLNVTEPGVKRNIKKRWAEAKIENNVNLKANVKV